MGKLKEKIETEAFEVLRLKSQGWHDADIRKKFGWSENKYRKLWVKIKDPRSGLLHENAMNAHATTVERYLWQYRQGLKLYHELEDKKQYNAQVGALRLLTEINERIMSSTYEFGIRAPNLDGKVPERKPEDLKNMTYDELYREYHDRISRHSQEGRTP